MKFLFFLICTCYLPFLPAITVGDKLLEASSGDYIVTEQDKNYSLLLLREKKTESVVFEEVSIPCNKIHLAGMDWEDWMTLGAPEHSSWIQYEIDLHNFKLIECYSVSKRGWLQMDESEHFFSKLLSLSLVQIPQDERKKVGPSPTQGDIDRRPLWVPSLLISSKKTKIPCETMKAFWPKDDSLLSSCSISLYFPNKSLSSFPIWIEASNGHFSYSIRGIYFGKNLKSPISYSVPKRPIQILKSSEKTEATRTLTIKSPAYYQNFSIFVLDVANFSEKIGPIPFILTPGQIRDTKKMTLSQKDLQNFLKKNHRYKWRIEVDDFSKPFAESEDFFLWNP